MIITNEQLKAIARAGGGLQLDASTLTFNDLKEIGAAASTGNARIVLKNVSGLTAPQLQALAAIAPGLISFDLTA